MPKRLFYFLKVFGILLSLVLLFFSLVYAVLFFVALTYSPELWWVVLVWSAISIGILVMLILIIREHYVED